MSDPHSTHPGTPGAGEPLASLRNVTRRFGDVVAVDDVSLDIHTGSILGLLGPNGAGKSTVLSLLNGLRSPSSGTVRLAGRPPSDHRARASLGTTPQESALPPALRVREVIDLVGAHYPDPVPVGELADEFGLEPLLRRQTGALSGGQQRRLSVALAFVGRPRLVLLDEPTTGLDVDARRALWQAVENQHQRGTTVVVTSHYIEEIEQLAERVVVMSQGRVIADDALAAVLARVSLRQVRLRCAEPERLERLADVDRLERTGDDGAVIYVADSDAFIVDLVRSEVAFTDLTVRGASLEEAFLSLTHAPLSAGSSAPASAPASGRPTAQESAS